MEFGAGEDVDLSVEIFAKLSRTPAAEPAHSDNVAILPAQIHVFACSRFQMKGASDFSSLSSTTSD